MPRSAQFRRTAVHLYLPAWTRALILVTHAYVPQDHFDEVRQEGNWTVAAKDGAYIARGRGGLPPGGSTTRPSTPPATW